MFGDLGHILTPLYGAQKPPASDKARQMPTKPAPKPSIVPISPSKPSKPQTLDEGLLITIEPEKPIKDSRGVKAFKEAMEKYNVGDNIENAYNIYRRGDEELKKHCAEHLISLGSPRLTRRINHAKEEYFKRWLLEVPLVHADQTFLNELFKELNPSDDLLLGVAYSPDLACRPPRFSYLLNKVSLQGLAVRNAVFGLFLEKKSECFDALLSELKKNNDIFVYKYLEKIAIRTAFKEASYRWDDKIEFIKRYFNHPAISIEDYSDALYDSYGRHGGGDSIFDQLLAGANSQVLKMVQNDGRFSKHEGFKKAINGRLKEIDSGPESEIARRK